MAEPLDLAKIMVEHADHGQGRWCGATPSVVDEDDPDPDNCLPYRLAAELAEARQQSVDLFDETQRMKKSLRRVRVFRDECRREVARRDAMRMHGPHVDARDVAERLTAALAGEGTADQPKESS